MPNKDFRLEPKLIYVCSRCHEPLDLGLNCPRNSFKTNCDCNVLYEKVVGSPSSRAAWQCPQCNNIEHTPPIVKDCGGIGIAEIIEAGIIKSYDLNSEELDLIVVNLLFAQLNGHDEWGLSTNSYELSQELPSNQAPPNERCFHIYFDRSVENDNDIAYLLPETQLPAVLKKIDEVFNLLKQNVKFAVEEIKGEVQDPATILMDHFDDDIFEHLTGDALKEWINSSSQRVELEQVVEETQTNE
jgi:hypothetical protein